MERIKNLGRYQKGLLIVFALMLLIFTAVYIVVTSRTGFAYRDVILLPQEEGGGTVYSGKYEGKRAEFTVTADKTVTFRYGDKTYGPYTVQEDPSAMPEDPEMKNMTGVEIRCGDEIFFRGGVYEAHTANGKDLWLFEEDGSFSDINIYVSSVSGIMYDADGNEIDQMEPTAKMILQLTGEPELESKGDWIAWLSAVGISLMAAVSILFADELFRWNLRWVIRDFERAEPSEWEIASRYIGWTVIAVAALAIYIMGLGI